MEDCEVMRERFDAVQRGDVQGLASFASDYVLHRHKKQFGHWRDDDVFVPYLERLQNENDLIYLAYLGGKLTRDQMIELHMPLVEIRAKKQRRSNGQILDDIEGVGNLTLCAIFNNLPSDLESFAAFLVTAVDRDIINFLAAERSASRHQHIEGRKRVDPDTMSGGYNHVAAVDAKDEIDSLARDEVDRTILKMRAEGYKDREIAERVNKSQQAVSARGLAMEERLAIVAADSIDDLIIAMKVDGRSEKQIARKLNINVSTVIARHASLERQYREPPALFPSQQDDLRGGLSLAL